MTRSTFPAQSPHSSETTSWLLGGHYETFNHPPPMTWHAHTFGSPAGANGAGGSTSPVFHRGAMFSSTNQWTQRMLFNPSFDGNTIINSSPETFAFPSILIRRLSQQTSRDSLANMLMFTEDLIDTDFIASRHPEDAGYATAVAMFRCRDSALEAQRKLDGKRNNSWSAPMIVEVREHGVPRLENYRASLYTTNPMATPNASNSTSPDSSSSRPRTRSRYNTTFIANAQSSFSTDHSNGSMEFCSPETGYHLGPFSTQSQGLSGRSAEVCQDIQLSATNDGALDSNISAMLDNPGAHDREGHGARESAMAVQRSVITEFDGLSLNTNSGQFSAGTSLRHFPIERQFHTPASSRTAQSHNRGERSYSRDNNQRANREDLYAPKNTLFIGNIPIQTREEELKQLFCKERGYKRMIFKTDVKGHMCFVEFVGVTEATQALAKLYGHHLTHSVKGGIRVTYSKNELGVRSPPDEQATRRRHPQQLGQYAHNTSFQMASGPPPGLTAPAGRRYQPDNALQPLAYRVDRPSAHWRWSQSPSFVPNPVRQAPFSSLSSGAI